MNRTGTKRICERCRGLVEKEDAVFIRYGRADNYRRCCPKCKEEIERGR